MKSLITIAFLVLLSCQIGISLKCYVGVKDQVIEFTCNAGEVCGKIKFNGEVVKSCTPQIGCDVAVGGEKMYCCNTDLCNSAVSTRMSFATIIAVLVVFWVTKLSST